MLLCTLYKEGELQIYQISNAEGIYCTFQEDHTTDSSLKLVVHVFIEVLIELVVSFSLLCCHPGQQS